jgi:hypothetical protein
MHRFAMELRTVVRRMIAAHGQRPTVPLAIIKAMIHVTVKTFRSVVPRTGADENAA